MAGKKSNANGKKKETKPKEKTKPKTNENEITKVLDKYNWVVFGLYYCTYCHMAEDLLVKEGKGKMAYVEVAPEKEPGAYQLFTAYIKPMIKKQTGKSYDYFPVIFHNKKFIGGYSELEDLLNSNGMRENRSATVQKGNGQSSAKKLNILLSPLLKYLDVEEDPVF